jgi:cystathionine beta-lyase
MDNTWATPLYFKAFAHGVDVSIHAGTKYIVGHSDAMIGMVNCSAQYFPQLRSYTQAMGLCAAPEEAYLALRGLRTLAVRLAQHQASALAVAEWCAARPEIEEVLYPALAGAPGHALWQRDFSGATGLFSLVFKPVVHEKFRAMVDALTLFGLGFSWGGYESLKEPFVIKQFCQTERWPYAGPGLRLHIGLEAVADLLADLEQAFAHLK